MQYKNNKTLQLIKALGNVIKEERQTKAKSQTMLAYEYELDSGNLCRVENGKIEAKISMLWRIAEALDIPLSSLIEKLEQKLGKDFCIIEK